MSPTDRDTTVAVDSDNQPAGNEDDSAGRFQVSQSQVRERGANLDSPASVFASASELRQPAELDPCAAATLRVPPDELGSLANLGRGPGAGGGAHLMPPVHVPEADPEAGSPRVYGATSMLHDQDSESPLTNCQGRTAPGAEDTATRDGLLDDVVRDRLISFAALRAQEEWALHYYAPSHTANIDFDGVPMEMAMHLLDLHWNRQHLSYLLTYRPAIMDSLIRNGPHVNKLLLNAIYLQSSLYSDRISLRSDPADPQTVGKTFFDRFKALLGHYILKPTIPTIVALLTCGASLVPHGRQSEGWVICGIAYRMITDLGCHLDVRPGGTGGTPGSKLAAIDVEMRRRVYWGAYVGDKFQSLFLGRPPSMPANAGNVPREFMDSYEEMEKWRPYADPQAQPFDNIIATYQRRPAYALSTFRALLDLCDIAGQIIDSFYSVHSAETPRDNLIMKRDEIRDKLSAWSATLPSWLQFDPGNQPPPPPHQITPQ